MVGGLVVANKMGITGSGYALAVASKGMMWAQTKAKRYGLKAGRGTIRKALPRERLQKLESLGVSRGFLGRHLAAPARAIGRQAVRTDAAITKAREAEFLEEIKNLAPFQVSDMYAGLSEEKRAYALKHMIDKGYDWELVPQARKDIVKWAEKDASGKSTFDKNQWGLKKAELDLIDSGISPGAFAKMEEYRPRLEKALKDGDHEEVERIKYILGLEVEKILRKDLNVVTPNGMGKLQRRTFSDSVPGKVGYAMFGDDEVGASMASLYGGAQMRYVSLDRAESFRRLKGALRSDGTRNLSKAGTEGIKTLQNWFIDPLVEAGIIADRAAFQGQKAPEQIKTLKDHWITARDGAIRKVYEEVGQKRSDLSLTDKQYGTALEVELEKVRKAVPEKLVADLKQLVQSTEGAAHATLAI
ncbi:MAG: hypothetical protein HYW38_02010 [Candidatus Colwellbacteria bacterium]|nr:hypothetical protein [Candidatus Colwellbacteria bacterium]